MSFQATVHLLRLQGVKLNDHAVPPEATYQSRPGHVSYLPDSDPEWRTYRYFSVTHIKTKVLLTDHYYETLLITAKTVSP